MALRGIAEGGATRRQNGHWQAVEVVEIDDGFYQVLIEGMKADNSRYQVLIEGMKADNSRYQVLIEGVK